jgi:hypothetical protein
MQMARFVGAFVFTLCLSAALVSPTFAEHTNEVSSPVECHYYFVAPLEPADSWRIFVHRSTRGHSFFISFPAAEFDRYSFAFDAAGCEQHPPVGGF